MRGFEKFLYDFETLDGMNPLSVWYNNIHSSVKHFVCSNYLTGMSQTPPTYPCTGRTSKKIEFAFWDACSGLNY